MLKVAGVGGGTGLPVVLSGLKSLVDAGEEQLDITAIVTATDSGGSSGRLRGMFNMPAVGDIRRCLIALSEADAELTALCDHRFRQAGELEGHSAGNLLLSALFQMSGGLYDAVKAASRILGIRGTVLPSTAALATVCAEYEDGVVVHGEAEMVRSSRVSRVWLQPELPMPCPGVLEALASADVIVFGPGSLYTSIIPNLLVGGVAHAIRRSDAVLLYVCNLMTQPGETDGYSAADHFHALRRYLPDAKLDACVVNTTHVGIRHAERYSKSGSKIVIAGEDMGVELIEAPLMSTVEGKVRHDAVGLARLVVAAARAAQHQRQSRPPKEVEVICAESSAISVPEKCLAC